METALVGLFGYYGYVARGASDLCVIGANRLCDGVWNLSEVDPERGFCGPKADAEHTAEWTGNTLGLMMQIDYGNPLWIERSMKTGKLIRDLWTDYNDMGRRHFKSNFFGATQIGSGLQMNDSFINYRAISASTSVLAYNRNPTIGKLYTELADAWLYDSMRTDGGKPTGIIPAQVGWPDGRLGGGTVVEVVVVVLVVDGEVDVVDDEGAGDGVGTHAAAIAAVASKATSRRFTSHPSKEAAAPGS